jgi:hypothetical protein
MFQHAQIFLILPFLNTRISKSGGQFSVIDKQVLNRSITKLADISSFCVTNFVCFLLLVTNIDPSGYALPG